MDVGIRELKARLSHYVKVAHEGEQITVTDRGVPVAVLSKPPMPEVDRLPTALRRMISEGRATEAAGPFAVVPVTPARASKTWEEILAEDRGED
jgi:antitoxin (DNA-binding transcriptional repressor) of toxin-antitoxin stability system